MNKSNKHLLRANIIALYDIGWTMTKISAHLNISRNTVTLWINKNKNSESLEDKKRSGRKRKTVTKDDIKIIEIVKKTEKETCNNYTIDVIKKELEKINVFICNNTIISRMKEYNFYSAYPFKKPILTEKHKQDRLQWALENYNTDWSKIIFSDESKIIKDSIKKKIWIGPESKKIKRSSKHSIKRNIYACIHISGLVTYCIFTENMNSDKYIEILDSNFIDIYKNNSNLIYQQDNCRVHTSHKLKQYFKNNSVHLLNWPSNSPDLNPIENVWFLLKHKLSGLIITGDNFCDLIEKNLKEIKYEHIYNMIASMQIRVCKVIENNGDSIDY